MYFEMDMANDRAKQLREDASNYRLAKQARGGKSPAAWRSRLFKVARWGGSHGRSGQLM